VVIGRSYGGAVAVDLALRYPDRVRALVLLEGDALGLSPTGLEWTKAIRNRLRDVAAQDGVDAVYGALIGDVLGEGAWDSFPDEVRRVLTAMARVLPNARTALVGGGHLIDPAGPEVLAFIEGVVDSQ
jgi:pimeloyl-ACP methyl ester carboxylesterase